MAEHRFDGVPIMKTALEWVYWTIVALIIIIAVTYGAVAGWENFAGPFEHGVLNRIVLDSAIWLFPSSLLLGWMFLFFTFSDRVQSETVVAVAVCTHALLTLALAVWFYRSRRASLRLRGAVLAGLLIVGVAPIKIAELVLS